MSGGGGRWPARIRWLTWLSVAAVVAVNAAGIWGIAVARRGVLDQSVKVFRLEVAGRARSIESALSSTRADLAFLTGSPALSMLESALASSDPREARWRRLGAEGALLLFLRGHPEVAHLTAASPSGQPLVQAGRRGGVPVLWRSTSEPATEIPGGAVTAQFSFEPRPGAPAETARLGASIDTAALLARARTGAESSWTCELRDAAGSALAHEANPSDAAQVPGAKGSVRDPQPRGDPDPSEASMRAEAQVRVEGWSAPSPWTLACAQHSEAAAVLIEPLAQRYRITLGLNLAVMALALLLGYFAIQQARRRELLEATAREESRVREVERQLFHYERLSTVGRLAAGMAHEINNPLEGMSNYLALANESLARGQAESARKHLDRVREGIERAAGVVRQVLRHADPATAPRTPLDLNGQITESVEFVKARREFAGIAIDLDLDPAAPMVRGNAVTLGQVFLNLLLNACEAQPGGGAVSVRTRREGSGVLVEIADRGPGVSQADAARVFEPFYSTKRSTGLGLSICHAIVRQHEGDISVGPRPGGGAVFTLRFPASESPDA